MLRALAVVFTAFALVPAAPAAAPPLTTRLAEALAVPGNKAAESSALAIDLDNGAVILARTPTFLLLLRRTRSSRSPTPRCASSGPPIAFGRR